MSERNNLTFVEGVIEAIDKILRYLETVEDYQEFSKSDMVIDAVTRNYEKIGEAAKHINDEIKNKYPTTPWRQMYGLRNFAVHEYHIIDPLILWEIAETNLINNKEQLMLLLKNDQTS